MKYNIFEPPDLLKPYVKYISTLDYNHVSITSNKIKVFADRYPHLVIQHNNGNSAYFKDGIALPASFLSGIKTNPYTCEIHYNHSATTITFYPYAIKILFGIDTFELNDAVPALENFAPNITELLINCNSHKDRINVITAFLTKKILQLKSDALLIKSITEKMDASNGKIYIKSLLSHYKFSERKLERLFKQHIGISPQLYLRTTRFEKSLELIRQNKYDRFSDIAYDLNFTDQSHFIKDFKYFSGFTPKKLVNQNFILDNTANSSTNSFININHVIVT